MKNKIIRNADYDQWHKIGYQTDLTNSLKRAKLLHNLVIKQLRVKNQDKSKKMLDVACGKGVFLKEVENRNLGLDLYGLDISDYAVQKAKEFAKAEFITEDAQNMPYENDYFDFITCLGGLEYYPDPEKGAQEIHRVLKRGGKACIHVPNLMFAGHVYLAWRYGSMPSEGAQNENNKFYDNEIEKLYTRDGWEKVIKRAGMEILSCKKYNYISASKKVSVATKYLYNYLLRPFVPLNLSYCFIFVCKK